MPDYLVRLDVHGYVEILVKGAESAGAAMDEVAENLEDNGYGDLIEDAYNDNISVALESVREFKPKVRKDD